MKHWILFQTVLFAAIADTTGRTCSYHSNVYDEGDFWVDQHVCDTCECNTYGVQCHAGLDGTGCKFNASSSSAGDIVCEYGMTAYLQGDVFNALDGCNKCLCTERGMECTTKACQRNGFEQPGAKPLYGECHYNGGWYRFHTQWLTVDGCNTCYCNSIGNYQGGYVCTRSACKSCKIAHASSIITG